MTLGGLAVAGATVDAWRDVTHREQWAARLWVPIAHPPQAGLLSGTAAGGQSVSGAVLIGDLAAAVHRGREQLVEFHGDGPLLVDAMSGGGRQLDLAPDLT